MMQVDRLDHLVLTVADVERSVAFYTEALGMTPVTFGPGRRAVSFGRQKINFHPARGNDIRPVAAQAAPGTADLCLITPDPIGEVQQHLAGTGVDVELGPVSREGALGTMTSVYFRDPDGNLIEVSRYDD